MMEISEIPQRKSYSRKNRIWLWALSIIVFILMVFSGLVAYQFIEEKRPNEERITLDFAGLDKPIFYQGKMQENSAIGDGEGLKLPFNVVKELIDPTIHYEEQTHSVIITTLDKVVKLKTNELTALMNEKPFSMRFPIEEVDGMIYLPVEPLLEYYKTHIRVSEETGAVFIRKEGEVIQWGVVLPELEEPEQAIAMRTSTTIKAPISADLVPNDRVIILREEANGWYQVQLENGYIGFIEKSKVGLGEIEVIPVQEKMRTFVPWKPIGGKINLTWEHVTRKNPDIQTIGELPGLNVISPTWFHLMEDKEGTLYVKNIADASYVDWAHKRGYQVWALFSNSFLPDLTSKALESYESRLMMTQQLVAYAELYNLDGINIDFENVHLKDKDLFTQFIREMTPFLHEQGLVVSIDVTIRGGSPMWSLFADRRELGKVVDYMMVMTYDEHWASSPKAGSVASLPWVEKGIVDIMVEDDVPASKLVLGVPYYARIWTEEYVDGKLKVSSKAKSMQTIKDLISSKRLESVYLTDIGQHYVQYKEGDKTFKIWYEDEVSMKSRIELVKKYDLAGVASWRRGFETEEIWEIIKETIEQRP